MSDVARDVSEQDRLQSYWDSIDQDPEVQERREAFEKAKTEGRLQEEAVLPSEHLRD